MVDGYDFSGRVVVITGGANGIGAATARAAAAAGATVVVLDLNEETGKALAAEHAGITFHRLDVSDHDEVQTAIALVAAEHGRIDGLVCCAIVQPLIPVLEMTPDKLSRVLDINLGGVVWASKAVAPVMARQNSGSIVYFASGTADFGKPHSSPYTASKGAVAGFAHTFAKEVAPYGVRVNLCRPGVIDTPQYRVSNPDADYSKIDKPEDAVGPVMFLLSDFATMTNSIVTREGTLPRTPRTFP
ncbi:SDR family NAD(P)-dependent oxidoreductase [Amycolatopsis alkalitolerans]|uniref:SDR family oxidoreductase n=1 Tax=Amycolatopsis alkalitolerans TaxID=2547244 RepID=A0A5C4LZY7_9PSEU|nr:SDR family oxidoreductase [Amycolatopsis alkalitolerans]TNC25731.1 SDR family oxidoreductase [Amycolatopsis alkalitolerans]